MWQIAITNSQLSLSPWITTCWWCVYAFTTHYITNVMIRDDRLMTWFWDLAIIRVHKYSTHLSWLSCRKHLWLGGAFNSLMSSLLCCTSALFEFYHFEEGNVTEWVINYNEAIQYPNLQWVVRRSNQGKKLTGENLRSVDQITVYMYNLTACTYVRKCISQSLPLLWPQISTC